jgi:hypothetical protein
MGAEPRPCLDTGEEPWLTSLARGRAASRRQPTSSPPVRKRPLSSQNSPRENLAALVPGDGNRQSEHSTDAPHQSHITTDLSALQRPNPLLDETLLGLSTRTRNGLKSAGITTLRQLAQLSESRISEIRNLGPKAAQEIEAYLEHFDVVITVDSLGEGNGGGRKNTRLVFFYDPELRQAA